MPTTVLVQLQYADRLAQAYRAAGYRGLLSLDSVVRSDGRVLFTEANVRFTSSTHLSEQIVHGVARVADAPERVVGQTLSPPSWQLQSFRELLQNLSRHGLAFDPALRRGVLAVTPVVHGSWKLLLAAVAENEATAVELVDSVHPARSCSPARAGDRH